MLHYNLSLYHLCSTMSVQFTIIVSLLSVHIADLIHLHFQPCASTNEHYGMFQSNLRTVFIYGPICNSPNAAVLTGSACSLCSQLPDPIRAAWQEDINRYCRVHSTFWSPGAKNKYSSQHITHPRITHVTLPGKSFQHGTKSHKFLWLPYTATTETWVCLLLFFNLLMQIN